MFIHHVILCSKLIKFLLPVSWTTGLLHTLHLSFNLFYSEGKPDHTSWSFPETMTLPDNHHTAQNKLTISLCASLPSCFETPLTTTIKKMTLLVFLLLYNSSQRHISIILVPLSSKHKIYASCWQRSSPDASRATVNHSCSIFNRENFLFLHSEAFVLSSLSPGDGNK